MPRLGGSPVVDIGATVGTPDEFTKPLGAGEPSPFLTQESFDIRVSATEEGRQKSERIGFIRGRVELELVRQVHGCHGESIAKTQQNTRTRPQKRRRGSAGPSAQNGEPRLRLGSPMLGRAPLWIPASAGVCERGVAAILVLPSPFHGKFLPQLFPQGP